VEAVEDVQRLGTVPADHVQVGLPHIRADEFDLSSEFFPHEGEETLEGFDGAFPADPQQADDPLVDLVDQRQVFVAFGILDFIHTDGACPASTISSRIDSSVRCSRPQPTTYSMASHALSQEVWNASAVSFQESFRAQRVRNSK
jgi:hypothetical protein